MAEIRSIDLTNIDYKPKNTSNTNVYQNSSPASETYDVSLNLDSNVITKDDIDFTKISASPEGVASGDFVKVNSNYFGDEGELTYEKYGDNSYAIKENGITLGFTSIEGIKTNSLNQTQISQVDSVNNSTIGASSIVQEPVNMETIEGKINQQTDYITGEIPPIDISTVDAESINQTINQTYSNTTSDIPPVDVEDISDEIIDEENIENENISSSEIPPIDVEPINESGSEEVVDDNSEVVDETEPSNATNYKENENFKVTYDNQKYNLSDSDLEFLMATVAAECDKSKDDALAVTSVILNRCEDPAWVNSFGDSPVNQIKAPGQFEVYSQGLYSQYMGYNVPDEVKTAVLDALDGVRNNNYLSFRSNSSTQFSSNMITDSGNRYS